jgi:hypothetical protein
LTHLSSSRAVKGPSSPPPPGHPGIGAAEELRGLCQIGGDFVWAEGDFYGANAQSKRIEARDHFYAGRDAYQAILDAH